jgi:two-component system, OmpR family, sensor kinase
LLSRANSSADKPQWVFQVIDGGPGVKAVDKERIFEPFYRVAGASESSGGVGLGLALVRQIARFHHGTVQCLDREMGSCFEVRLPLHEPAA